MAVKPERVHHITGGAPRTGPVVYWMSRDQRAGDNWALIHAQDNALERESPLVVVFSIAPGFLGAAARQYDFMFAGLRETADECRGLNIPFVLLTGDPGAEVAGFTRKIGAGALVTDFDPLRIKRRWEKDAASRIAIPFYEVDAHNVVPCRMISQKREYAARTLRPKLHRALPEYLDDFPVLRPHPHSFHGMLAEPDWEGARRFVDADESVPPVTWLVPGPSAAHDMLETFIHERLRQYHLRNDPTAGVLSNLSPYLHFGQLSAQRVALEVMRSPEGDNDNAASFLEELIVRRELSDNFCWNEPKYDSLEAAPAWALKTLDAHREDRREQLYDYGEFEHAETHDPLWNAAQTEMLVTGKMHGYLRMYWAKKILEWSRSPENALDTAIRLNDRYELDGRDPNGYVGCLWSIAGIHDRPWGERPVYGTVRSMSYNGCRRKFDVDKYIRRMDELKRGITS